MIFFKFCHNAVCDVRCHLGAQALDESRHDVYLVAHCVVQERRVEEHLVRWAQALVVGEVLVRLRRGLDSDVCLFLLLELVTRLSRVVLLEELYFRCSELVSPHCGVALH